MTRKILQAKPSGLRDSLKTCKLLPEVELN
jgi:hypothetical protein